jgi:rhamnogalacturonyl hydrolase YesR
MFSFGPFVTLYTLTYTPTDTGAWGDLERQFGLLGEHCVFTGEEGNEVQGLLVHGYDGSKTAVWANNSLGQSPHVWGRSLGWYVLGLLDTVDVLSGHAGAANLTEVQSIKDAFVGEFRRRMEAIALAADPETGAWWQILDQPGRAGNYIESSGSSMFAYALLAGVRKGYLDANSAYRNTSYVDIGRRAHGYLKDTFVVDNGNGTLGWNGTVSVCSLNSTASYEYYTSRPILYNSVLGSAAFMALSLEVERLMDIE